MKKLMVAGLMIIGFFLANIAMADDLKVGVVDLQVLLSKAPQVEKIRVQLQKQFKPREEKLDSLAKALKVDMDKLYRDGAVMKEGDQQALQEKITKQRRELRGMQEDLQEDVNNAQQAEMQTFLKKVNEKLIIVAQQKHLDMVFLKDSMPYSSSKIDVTDDVLKTLTN